MIFAFDKTVLGKCNLVEHSIDTKDEKPVHKNPYQYPLKQRKEIQAQVQEMFQNGIIKP